MFRKDENDIKLESVITDLLNNMNDAPCDSKEYKKMIEQLSKLYEIKQKNRVSKETWATIIAHLAGITLIIGHERANVITSKAVSFLTKLR